MTTFTAKHFKAIAELLEDGQLNAVKAGKHSSKKEFRAYNAKQLVDRFALAFEKDNPKFNREKFIEACGFTVGEDGLIE